MSRRHRANPSRRRARDVAYKVNVWRSVAILISDDPPLDDVARRVLAAHLVIAFKDTDAGLGMEFPVDTPDEFIACVKEMYESHLFVIEDGIAHISWPDRDALGRTYARRVPQDEMPEFREALRQSIRDDLAGDL